MMARRAECPLTCPTQAELDEFLRAGINIMALATPRAMQIAIGGIAGDGLFEPHAAGQRWCAFAQGDQDEIVFWHRTSGAMTSWTSRCFALGEQIIGDPATFSFDCALNIFADPIDWLRARRDGIVILPDRWSDAFDRLRDCPRIALAERLLPLYRRHMKPSHMPELTVIPDRRRAA